MLRRALQTKRQIIESLNLRILNEQSWIKKETQKQKVKEGEWGPIKKALGLLRPNELTRILKGCNIPISPKCKGKNILQDNDCLPQHILKMKMGCLAKAVKQKK